MHRKNATSPALFALGFISIGTQIYLVREVMMVFNDNELIIGLVIATWMLITGIGSSLGRFTSFLERRESLLCAFLVLTGILPSFMVAGLDLLKVFLVPFGSMADLWMVMGACILVQMPFCLLNGFLFSYLSVSSAGTSPGVSYSWESLGSMVSGGLVNFLFLWFTGPFLGLLMLTTIYLLLVIFFMITAAPKKQVLVVIFISLGCIVFSGTIDFKALTEKMLYPSQHVISTVTTPFGKVVITKNADQLNFYDNGILLFSSGNQISNEENVHYAMVQQPNPANILIISGGFSGTVAEVLKYKPVRIDYVELNPSLIEIAVRYTHQLCHPCVHVYQADARKFIRNTTNRYDVVLVNLPAPSTLQLNRYYSMEFLMEARRKMNPGAIIAYSLPPGGDYMSDKASRLNAVLWNTLKQCFAEILILPSGRNYFLASDSSLSGDIPGLIQSRGIKTVYVNKYYLDFSQLKQRSQYVTQSVTQPGPVIRSGEINRDFTPVAVWYQTSWWLSQFKTTQVVILLVFIVVMAFLLITLNPLNAGLFAGGFTLASSEMIIIFGLQVLCGYLFQAIGAIFMVFMFGLAAGSGLRFKTRHLQTPGAYRWLQVSLALLAILIPVMIECLSNTAASEWLINLVLAMLAFSAACIVGMEYRLAVLLSAKTARKTVAGNYAAEMWGAAAGAFLTTLFLIPTIGIVNTGILMAIINLATAGLLFKL